MYKQTFYIIGR